MSLVTEPPGQRVGTLGPRASNPRVGRAGSVAVTERMLSDTCLALVGPIKLTSVEMCGHANRADEAPSLNPYKAIRTTDGRRPSDGRGRLGEHPARNTLNRG